MKISKLAVCSMNKKPVIGKEWELIHNSIFYLFGIAFQNAPIPTQEVELVVQRWFQFHGMGGLKGIPHLWIFLLSILLQETCLGHLVLTFFQFFQLISNQKIESIGIPPLHWIEGGVAAPIPGLEYELEVNSIPRFTNGIGIDAVVPMTARSHKWAQAIFNLVWDGEIAPIHYPRENFFTFYHYRRKN